jgi:hypothetical protein
LHTNFAKLAIGAAVPDPETSKSVQCPECRSFDVRRSYPNGFRDAIMNTRGWTALRCRRCSYRFYRKLLPGEKLGLPEVTGPEQP